MKKIALVLVAVLALIGLVASVGANRSARTPILADSEVPL